MNKNFITKLKIILSLLIKSKFNLKNPKQADIIIYDSNNTEDLKKILPNDKFTVLQTRVDEFKEFYFSFNTIFFILTNILKRSFKQNYLISLINQINPKVVVTLVDNSSDFHITAKFFSQKKIKFLAIQSSDLRATDYIYPSRINKIFYIPKYFCYSSYEKKLFEKTEAKILEYVPVGSLRASNFLSHVKTKNLKLEKTKYDICLIGEPASNSFQDFPYVDNFIELSGKIAEYTHRVCKKNKLNLIFSGKNSKFDPYLEEEELYYKNFLSNYDFKIVPRSESFSTFINAYQSKLIIGHCSTFLREAFALEKKVLVCNLSGHKDLIFPSKGTCYLEKFDYETFEKKVLNLIEMPLSKYYEGMSESPKMVLNQNKDTADIIKNEILKNLN